MNNARMFSVEWNKTTMYGDLSGHQVQMERRTAEDKTVSKYYWGTNFLEELLLNN